MNEILFIVDVVVTFSMVVLLGKLFGRTGLIAWMPLATILANIAVTKQVTLFGLDTTLGNTLFASTFLATDILSEAYGKKSSKTAVNISMVSSVTFIVAMQIIMAYSQNHLDFVSGSMRTLFTVSVRASVASVVMFYIANMADVYLFEFLKKKIPGKLWARNNIATILCNCTENFFFVTLAFVGIYSFKDCVTIALTTTLFETVIAICDTPFVYLGRKVAKRD